MEGVGGLSKWVISRLISTLKRAPNSIGVMMPISLEKNYLLSPPTLQEMAYGLGHFQVGSYRYRSVKEGLYTL